ncbi:hypothetical protein ACTFIZ_000363 [Dictyostelium cf. discoideum]
MKLSIFYILILIQIINSLDPLFDREYIKKGLTSPPTTIYSVSYNQDKIQDDFRWEGSISRNDIKNNSKSMKLFHEFWGYHLQQGDILFIPNNQTMMFYERNNKDHPTAWRRGTSVKDLPFEYNLRFRSDILQPGYYIKNPSISIDDSNDYINVTAYFDYLGVGITIYSSLKPENKITIDANFPLFGDFHTYHDQLSHIYYMTRGLDKPSLYFIIADTKNLSSNTIEIPNISKELQSLGAYKKSFYFGEKSNNSKSYSIYKYDLTNIESLVIDHKNFTRQLVITIEHEITYSIPSRNLNYLIIYSKPSQILFMYNIDQSKMEEYYNFNMQEPTSRHKFYSFHATAGEPIEPEDENKLNILIPILCSIIGFSLIVFAIILTIIIIKRRNYKKFNDSNNIEMEKDNDLKSQTNNKSNNFPAIKYNHHYNKTNINFQN